MDRITEDFSEKDSLSECLEVSEASSESPFWCWSASNRPETFSSTILSGIFNRKKYLNRNKISSMAMTTTTTTATILMTTTMTRMLPILSLPPLDWVILFQKYQLLLLRRRLRRQQLSLQIKYWFFSSSESFGDCCPWRDAREWSKFEQPKVRMRKFGKSSNSKICSSNWKKLFSTFA